MHIQVMIEYAIVISMITGDYKKVVTHSFVQNIDSKMPISLLLLKVELDN